MADFNEINKELNRIGRFVKIEMLDIIGTEAVNHFTENFEKQGFDGKKWEDVKRRDSSSVWSGFEYGAKSRTPNNHPKRKGAKRNYKARKSNPITNYSPTARNTPILSSKRSELENSIQYVKKGNKIRVFTDKPYASIHNEGGKTTVFGKASATIPQRQFIGKSEALKKKIIKKIERKLAKK
jgi:phage gpG-like protein